jgi:integrase
MARKKSGRRTRSPHSGVVLQKRKYPSREEGKRPRIVWRARWADPDTGKTKYQVLDRLGLTNEDARVTWAKKKSGVLMAREAEIATGSRKCEPLPIEEGIEVFFSVKAGECRPSTLSYYRVAVERFRVWMGRNRIDETGDLAPPDLAHFRADLLKESRTEAKKGGRRGARTTNGRRLSDRTRNQYLAATKILLNVWRLLGLLKAISKDDISDALKRVKEDSKVPTFLAGPQIRSLIKAALRHDAATFSATRAEHAGEGLPGSTQRHPSIAPFVLTVLLTGARFSEVLGLMWSEVDLDARVIVLPPERVKTKTERHVPLSITPSLLALLKALQLQSGGSERVFGHLTDNIVKATKRRMLKTYGAPPFGWQELRRTCGTHLTCAPGIYGAASAFLSAQRLGHSVVIAERCYIGAMTEIPHEAKTLEQAMGIDALVCDEPWRGGTRRDCMEPSAPGPREAHSR